MQKIIVEWMTMLGEWGIVAAILYEGRLAFQEFRSARLLEMLKHIERNEVRQARYTVLTKVARKENQGKKWWIDSELHVAAASLASAYDQVGLMISFHGMGPAERTFLQHWGEGIVRTYEVLKDFLDWRRQTAPQSYVEYTNLYRRAKLLFPNVTPPEIEEQTEIISN
jgi:hypothetical protein